MEFRKNTVRTLAVAITIACIGLIAVQVRLLMNTADLKRSTFDQTVATALASAATAIDHLDVAERVFIIQDSLGAPDSHTAAWMQRSTDSTVQVSVLATDSGTVTTRLTRGVLAYTVDRPLPISIEAYDDRGRLDTTLVREQIVESGGSVTIPQPGPDHRIAYLRLRSNDGVSTFRMRGGAPASSFSAGTSDTAKRELLVRRVIDSFDALRISPRRTLEAATLDSIVAEHLRERSIDLPHAAAIIAGDSVTVISDSTALTDVRTTPYTAPVGSQLPFRQSEILAVSFPTATSYVFRQMLTELGLSIILVGVIVWAFVYSIRLLLRQKEFAGRLTDFINNMTHEFKTPISTIGLASEALDRSDVLRSAKKVRTYNGVIRDENLRMRGQIDRILQMATLEEGDVDFRKERLAMHTIIGRAVDATRLQVTARGGTITTQLDAPHDTVIGDALHVEGVLHNMLENAVKYSPETPSISVATRAGGEMIIIRVSDRGIGISPDQLNAVFDKFYRVPTGNLHDVKGFGLGLSYVKLVVEKHGGTVRIESELNTGTTLEIRLPLSHEA